LDRLAWGATIVKGAVGFLALAIPCAGKKQRGQSRSVRYQAVNAMLPNELLKEHRKVEEQEATIGQPTERLPSYGY